MSGKNKDEAREDFARSFRETIACVTTAPVVYGSCRDHERLMFAPDRAMALDCGESEPIRLRVTHEYSVERLNDAEWGVRSRGYVYDVNDAQRRLLFSYHWHPWTGLDFPHLHIKSGAGTLRPDVKKAHFPSGRIPLESVLKFLVKAFRVRPIRDNWEELLKANLDYVENNRTWA